MKPKKAAVFAATALLVLYSRPRIPGLVSEIQTTDPEAVFAVTPLYTSLFILLGLLTLLQAKPWFARPRLPKKLLLLLAIFILANFWSVDLAVSIRYTTELIFATTVALAMGVSLRTDGLINSIKYAAWMIVALSVLYIGIGAPQATFNAFGGAQWRGALSNPNDLGRWAVVAAVMALNSSLNAKGGRRFAWVTAFVSALLVAVRTGSSQAVGIGMFLAVLLLILRAWRSGSITSRGIIVASHFLIASAFTVIGFFPSILSFLVGGNNTLSERLPLWSAILKAISDRPLLGYGPGAFWGSEAGLETRLLAGFPASHGHNSYLDAALQYGLLAALVFTASLVYLIAASIRSYILLGAPQFLIFAIILLFIFLYSLSASVAFARPFTWWVILVAVATTLLTRPYAESDTNRHPKFALTSLGNNTI